MIPTSYNAPGLSPPVQEPKYPDYYILDIGDLTQDFAQKWREIIDSETIHHQSQPYEVFPEVFTIGEDGTLQKQVYTSQHRYMNNGQWYPDISLVVGAAIDVIKSQAEIQQDISITLQLLWYDVASMAHLQIKSNVSNGALAAAYTDVQCRIADLSVDFGKKLYQRLIDFGLYKNGYFPYHYAGWQNDCALVALDDTHR